MVLTGQCLDLIKAYRTQLIALGAVVVVVAVAVLGWQYYRGYQRDLASQDYNNALREYQEGRYQEALESFTSLRTRGEPPYDALANLYVANSHIALDQPAKAVEALESSPENDRADFLNQVRLVTLGLAQEMNGSCEEAVQSLSRALEHPGPLRQEALLGKARCTVQMGKVQEAADAYKAYLKEFPEGETVEIALQMQQLEGRSSEKTAP